MYLDGLLKKKVIPKKSRVKLEVGMTVLDQNTVKCNKKSPTPMTIISDQPKKNNISEEMILMYFLCNELENKDRSFILQMDDSVAVFLVS